MQRRERRTHKRKKERGALNILFANVTSLSPKATTFLTNQNDFHVLGIAETHKRGSELQDSMREFKTAGWDVIAAPAQQSDRSTDGTLC